MLECFVERVFSCIVVTLKRKQCKIEMDGCKQMDGGGYFMGVRLMYE